MAKTLEDIKNEWIDHIGEKSEKFGFPRIAGQLEGLLYLSQQPMSLDEMAARLEVSKASASTNVRLLEQWKVVRRAYQRGARKNLYQFAGDIWEIETEIISTIVKDEVDRAKQLVDRTERDLKTIKTTSAAQKKEVRFFKERIKEMRESLEASEYFLNLLISKGKVTPAVVKKIKIS